ncbi:hypothetical protein DL93DRAFT_2084920 [Clavulina sp. PMI_390]|nr:hypothetical protein DL93DRAFT_2084920 [Clavulina sp. PMI_390]
MDLLLPSILRFTRSVILNPNLGNHVRKLSVSPVGCEYDDFAATLDAWNESDHDNDIEDTLSKDDLTFPDVTVILSALPALGLSNGLVLQGRKDGIFIVLLYLLPKLHVLNIEAEPSLRCIAYACFGAYGGRIPDSLQSIVTLEISGKGDPMTDGGFATEEVLPFMTLPSLKTFTVYDFSGVETPHLQIRAFVRASLRALYHMTLASLLLSLSSSHLPDTLYWQTRAQSPTSSSEIQSCHANF